MSLVNRLLPYIIILAVVTMVPDVSLADMGLVIQMFDVKTGTEPVTVKAGPADLVMTITARNACDKIYISVTQIDNMSYTGPMTMGATVGPTLTAAFRIPIIIAANDTCGLEFKITSDKADQIAKTYWVSSSDTTKFYTGNPRLHHMSVESVRLGEPIPKKPRLGRKTTVGYFDSVGNPISKEEALKARERPQPPPLGRPAKPPTDEEKMHALEQEPLTKSDRQIFVLDGEAWSRNRGEKEFHRDTTSAIRKEDIPRYFDEIRAKNMVTDFDVTLDLRDTALYKIAQSMVGKLTPMDTLGYYRTTASGALLKQLRSHGIYDAPYPQFPRDRTMPRKCGETDSLTQPDK